jgi:Flp pilus assembly protein TadD
MIGNHRLALILIATALPAASQGVSQKDLEEMLGADVTQWGNDGKLKVHWPFKSREELKGFDPQGGKLRIVDGEGLAVKEHEVAVLRELHFQPPCRISMEVKLEDPSASPVVVFPDGDEDGVKTICFVNAKIYGNSDDRFHGSYLARHEDHNIGQRYAASALAPEVWYPVAVTVAASEMKMQVGTDLVWAQRVWPHQSFRFALACREGKCAIRNLRIDGQVVVASMRKLANALWAKAGAGKARAKAWKGVMAFKHIASEMEADEGVSDPCESAFRELPETLVQRHERAMKAAEQGKLEAAREFLEECVREHPESPVLHWSLGRILLAQDRMEAAAAAFRAAVTSAPGIPEPWSDLGNLLVESGDLEEAATCLEKAGELNPEDPWVHVGKAGLHLANTDLEAAEREVAAARKQRPASKGLKLFSEEIGRLRSRPAWPKSFKERKGDYEIESDISSRLCSEIGTKLIYYRRFLESSFPLGVKQEHPCRVWIFDSEEAYHVFSDTLARRHDRTAGVYHPLIKTLLLFGRISPKETQEVLFHEAFHQYLDLAVRHPPPWFNEGLAEYFGATTFDSSWRPTEGGIQRERLGHLRQRLDTRPPLPFKEIMTMPQHRFMDEDAPFHYAQSWAMVHWFLRGGHGGARRLFDDYRRAVLAGKSISACFDASFGAQGAPPRDGLQAAFLAYVKGI